MSTLSLDAIVERLVLNVMLSFRHLFDPVSLSCTWLLGDAG